MAAESTPYAVHGTSMGAYKHLLNGNKIGQRVIGRLPLGVGRDGAQYGHHHAGNWMGAQFEHPLTLLLAGLRR